MDSEKDARYSAVLFDVDGTLLDYGRAEAAALETAFARRGLRFTPQMHAAFRVASQEARKLMSKNAADRDAFRVGRFERLFAGLGIEEDAAAFNELFLSCLAETPYPLEGAGVLCRTLFEAGVTLAVASNGLEWFQAKRLEAAGLISFFSKIITSERAGSAKPEQAFFHYAWTVLGCPPKNRVLMVGDSLTADIEGSKQMGFDACWVTKQNGGCSGGADYVVPSLEDVISVVCG